MTTTDDAFIPRNERKLLTSSPFRQRRVRLHRCTKRFADRSERGTIRKIKSSSSDQFKAILDWSIDWQVSRCFRMNERRLQVELIGPSQCASQCSGFFLFPQFYYKSSYVGQGYVRQERSTETKTEFPFLVNDQRKRQLSTPEDVQASHRSTRCLLGRRITGGYIVGH